MNRDPIARPEERRPLNEGGLRHDYGDQAGRYDRSRGVSPDVLDPIATALEAAPGRRLLDVGGGTGNYAAALRERGWSVTVLDASAHMRAQAAGKGLAVSAGDATKLPFADGAYDAVTMISMLHQVADWRSALAEARRVVGPGGVLAVMGLFAEHLREVTWAYQLFPSMGEFALARRPSLAQVSDAIPGATVRPLWFTDLADASIGALCAHPDAMLDPDRRRQTSFFERLEQAHPEELERGLATLRSWLDQGRRPERERAGARERLGDAVVVAWTKPAD